MSLPCGQRFPMASPISANRPPPSRWWICASATATASTWWSALKRQRPDARAIVLTGYGNIATAVTAVKMGAVDYLSKPADADERGVAALLASGHRENLKLPNNPMSADRVRWEHIQRIYEMCNRNVSENGRGPSQTCNRRTLQRILAKTARRGKSRASNVVGWVELLRNPSPRTRR